MPGNSTEAVGLSKTIPPLKSDEKEHETTEPVIDRLTTEVQDVPVPGYEVGSAASTFKSRPWVTIFPNAYCTAICLFFFD